MGHWLKSSYNRLVAMAGRNRSTSMAFGRILGPSKPENVKLRLLVVADAAGATLQINFLRPIHAALAAGDVRIMLLTEDDERLAVKSGYSPKQLVAEAWEQASPDLVFVSRYGGSLAADLLQKSSQAGVPLVYHLDDNLFEVPIEAGIEKAKKYGTPSRQQAIRTLLENASVVYLSTVRLAAQLRERCQLASNVFIGKIASASNPLPSCPSAAPRRPSFGYMASSSHAADLQLALPGIVAGLRAHPDLHFTVFGSLRPPPELGIFDQRVEHVSAIGDYDDFLKHLASMRWDWGIAPLQSGRFNEAKTDTKWVEYSAAGVASIVSRHPVYHDCSQGGAAVTVGDLDWAEKLPHILGDRALADRTMAAARQRLVHHHGLIHMAIQLCNVFKFAGLQEELATVVCHELLSQYG